MPRALRSGGGERIDSPDALERFVSTRAAFIAQKTLYGYLKARMGTSFPRMFEDDTFAESINIAKMNYYDACLSDLAVHSVARALHGCAVGNVAREELSARCHSRGLLDNQVPAKGFSIEEAQRAFRTRLLGANWSGNAMTSNAFALSPEALVRWAPIVKAHKDMDTEYVMNSVRFAWIDIRRELGKGLDREAICAEYSGEGR